MANTGGNPRWWEDAVAGLCSHGGHGWDETNGETCSDAPAIASAAGPDGNLSPEPKQQKGTMTTEQEQADAASLAAALDTYQECGECHHIEPSTQTSDRGIHCSRCGNKGTFSVGPRRCFNRS